LAIDFGGPAGS